MVLVILGPFGECLRLLKFGNAGKHPLLFRKMEPARCVARVQQVYLALPGYALRHKPLIHANSAGANPCHLDARNLLFDCLHECAETHRAERTVKNDLACEYPRRNHTGNRESRKKRKEDLQ